MARQKRDLQPGVVTHLISRFVNGEYRLETEDERADYLARVEFAVRRTDWHLLAFALMSTHVHWAVIPGRAELDRMFRSLHGGFATWLNLRQGRGGPLFRERPRTIQVPVHDAFRLIRYVHNNPCRAGVAKEPEATTWTSHRMYVGASPALRWLDIELGYRLAGLHENRRREAMFDAAVRAESGDPRDPVLSGDDLRAARREVRKQASPVAEVGTATLSGDAGGRGSSYTFHVPQGAVIRRRWCGDVTALVSLACSVLRVSTHDVRNGSRRRPVTFARRVVLHAGREYLCMSLTELSGAVGVSLAAGSRLSAQAQSDPAVDELARRVSAALCGRATA
jgi:hypothetical protein